MRWNVRKRGDTKRARHNVRGRGAKDQADRTGMRERIKREQKLREVVRWRCGRASGEAPAGKEGGEEIV